MTKFANTSATFSFASALRRAEANKAITAFLKGRGSEAAAHAAVAAANAEGARRMAVLDTAQAA